MRKIIRLLLYLLSIIPLLFLTVILILQVPAINKWALNVVIDMTPGLEIQKIEGQLFHKLTLIGISYQSDEFKLNVQRFSSQFSPADLFVKTVQFDHVNVSGVKVEILNLETKEDGSEEGNFTLPVALDLEQINITDISVSANDQIWQIEKVIAALHWYHQTINIKKLQVAMTAAEINANGEIDLSEQLPFNLQIAAKGNVKELGDIQGTVKLSGDKDKIDFTQQMNKPFNITASGSVLLETEQPQFALQGAWRKLYWPLEGQASYMSNLGTLSIHGKIDDYRAQLNGDFHGPDIPYINIGLQAKGNTEHLQLTAVAIETLEGKILGAGQLDWKDTTSWDIQLNASSLKPETIFPDYPGDINFDMHVSGNSHDQLKMVAEVKNLQGTLQTHALGGNAKVSYVSDSIVIEHFLLQLGENQLQANGTLDKKSSLDYALDANNLTQLYSGLSGQIKATGSIQGNYVHPAVALNLDAQAIGFEQYQMNQANIAGTLDFATQGDLEMSAEAMQINIDGTRIDKMDFQVSGNLSAHRVTAAVKSEHGDLNMKVDGSFEQTKQFWDGHIVNLQIMNSLMGDWVMTGTTPVNISVQSDNIKINNPDLCLRSAKAGGQACIRTAWTKVEGQQLAGHIKELPLDAFANWLPEDLRLESQLSAQFDFKLDKAIKGELSINTEPGQAMLSSENQNYKIPLKRSGLQAKLDNNQLQSRFGINFNDQDNISGDLGIIDVSNTTEAKFNGKVGVNIADLGFLNAFVATVTDIQGKLDIELSIQGPLMDPMLTAMNGSIKNTGFSIPDAGISISEININAVPEYSRTFLKGNADIGGKALLLDGWIEKDASGMSGLDLRLQGEQLKIVQLANAEIWTEPDLHLLLDQRGLSLKGEIGIPKADITIEELPEDAVTVSKDEVIISHEQTLEKTPPFDFNAKVLIKLGNEVAIQGHGLKTRLEGDLLAVYKKNQFMLYNELELVDGTYQAYGQDLKIEKGKLIFTGAIDNPGVSLLASRESTEWEDKVVAYLQLTGTLNDTETKVYTKPALSESESLAYLLTGAPLDQASGSNSAMLAKAALSLGKDYIDGVMAVVGIDEFDVKSTQAGSNSMVLGKRITPKLFVRYILDVLTSRMLFSVEYKLTDQISIETRAGDTHSSDIKYTIEFD